MFLLTYLYENPHHSPKGSKLQSSGLNNGDQETYKKLSWTGNSAV